VWSSGPGRGRAPEPGRKLPTNHETHLSLYAKDPDGLEFELTWFVPADKVPAAANRFASHPLDLDAEVARLGADPP
jgi:hypothetical protein